MRIEKAVDYETADFFSLIDQVHTKGRWLLGLALGFLRPFTILRKFMTHFDVSNIQLVHCAYPSQSSFCIKMTTNGEMELKNCAVQWSNAFNWIFGTSLCTLHVRCLFKICRSGISFLIYHATSFLSTKTHLIAANPSSKQMKETQI